MDGVQEAHCGLVPLRNNFLLPTAKLDDQKFEFYFLLDTSGSMAGSPINLAKRALTLFLQSLPEDCYFNVLQFDSSYSSLFPSSVKYSQSTLQTAKDAVAGFEAGGGTELYDPLNYVYSRPQVPGYLTQIFTITDGEVLNPDTVLNLVASKAKHSRSFSLGIGEGVDKDLVRGIAENAGGMYEFVSYSDAIESKILYQLKVALRPALLKPIRDVGAARLIPMYED